MDFGKKDKKQRERGMSGMSLGKKRDKETMRGIGLGKGRDKERE